MKRLMIAAVAGLGLSLSGYAVSAGPITQAGAVSTDQSQAIDSKSTLTLIRGGHGGGGRGGFGGRGFGGRGGFGGFGFYGAPFWPYYDDYPYYGYGYYRPWPYGYRRRYYRVYPGYYHYRRRYYY